MTTILRFLQVLSLGVWVGAAFFVGLLLAPDAFATMPTRELAGNVVGMALARLHLLGYACGALYLVASATAARGFAGLVRPAAICVVVMLLLTAVSHHGINAKLADLRAQMTADFGSVDATPRDHPLRSSFGRLHGMSSAIELVVLLLGAVALYLTLRRST
ncbi:MAG: DUF4149 domain-containing protein [Candidatus Acidiferrales bacterium]